MERAGRDGLTELLHRGRFDELGEQAVATSLRTGKALTLLVIDADHFKSINDRFGHSEGDRVLKMIAELLVRAVGAEDKVFRIGGEEFAILCAYPARARQAARRKHPPVGGRRRPHARDALFGQHRRRHGRCRHRQSRRSLRPGGPAPLRSQDRRTRPRRRRADLQSGRTRPTPCGRSQIPVLRERAARPETRRCRSSPSP